MPSLAKSASRGAVHTVSSSGAVSALFELNRLADPQLYVVKEDGEPSLRMWALSMLIEDRQEPAPSYNQFLTMLKGESSVALP